MVDWRTLWLLLPRPLRRLPADLATVVILTIFVNIAVFGPVVRETPLRVPLGLIFVLFIPGYVFIAALFPEAGDSPGSDSSDHSSADADDEQLEETWSDTYRSGIDGIERTALAFGLSIAIVPLIGLVLNFTPWGIRLGPIMVATTTFTFVTAALAAYRRWQLPADERFRVPYREWYDTAYTEIVTPDSRLDGALNVLLVASIVLALGSVTFAIVVPPQGEQFSAVYLLTEDDDGELVADGYPSEFVQGDAQPVIVGVDNHEHRTVEYTVVVLEQAVDTSLSPNETVTETEQPAGEAETDRSANATVNETVVTEQRELDRFETQLEHNESWHYEHDLEPTIVGEDVRLVWLLFPDDVPADPSMDDTEYAVHLWVDVLEATD